MGFVFCKTAEPSDEDPFEHLTADGPPTFEDGYKRFVEKSHEILRLSKAADANSLTERIAIVLAKCFIADNGSSEIVAFSQIWDEFVAKLREFWENNEYLPG